MTAPIPSLPTTEGPEEFLRRYEEFARPLGIRHANAYWRFCCTGEPSFQQVVREVEETLSDLHADTRVCGALARWLEQGVSGPLVARQLRVLQPDYRRAQVPETLRKKLIELGLEVEETFAQHRACVGGVNLGSNDLDRILLAERDDDRRREAWEATRQVGGIVEQRVVELARLRNLQARQIGFRDFRALALDDEEMPEDLLDDLLLQLRQGSDGPWRVQAADLGSEFGELRGKAASDLMPWDFPDRFMQSIPRDDPAGATDAFFQVGRIREIASSFYAGLGLPVDAILDASDLLPRERKYPHAFCIGIDIPRDVRILCNLDATSRWMETLLHELGHALYNAHIDPGLPWLLRDAAHTFVTEAVAMFFGRLVRDPEWLASVAGVPDALAERAGQRTRESQLVFARWALVVTSFEKALYADPESDLASTWWGLASELQGLRRPRGWAGADWASKVHVACYPVYYQDYLLGEMLASQIGCALGRHTGRKLAGCPEAGDFLRRLFRDGMTARWDDTVVEHTGQPLGADAWLREFTR